MKAGSRLRRLVLGGACSALLVTGGSGLLAVALSDGPAGADNTLGGFTVNALAESISVQYEQPNFPVPATPSLEFDEGYSATSDNYGPTGSATASTLYPGQVVANAGSQLALLVPGLPLPAAPAWPVDAISDYPQAPNTASTDLPGVNMDAQSSTNGNTATATLGNDAATSGSNGGDPTKQAPSGTGNVLAGSNALLGVGGLSATSSSQAPSTTATADATATVGGISMLGGFIQIGSITSTAEASSDGTTGKVTGSTQVQNVSIAGEQISITANGIQALDNKSLGALPVSALNTLLKELGITIAVTTATDKVNGPSASRELDGLEIEVNLDTLDTAANKFASLLPAKLISQLPVAIPNEQLITFYFGRVQVNSTAAPSFVASNSGSTGAAAASSSPSTGASATGDSGSSFTGSTGSGAGTGATSFAGNTGTGGSSPSGGNGTGGSPLVSEQTSTVGETFKGIGAALILLGLLAAAALAYLYKRADDMTDALGTTCSGADPLMERFTATPDELSDFGGFG
ncbi:MAG TPA: choice-of-anchor P family protein [Acidimicrobiales bacterium]|nr:choice-of-anchor P family protein [Acidimicrobiales bacterium]